MRNHIGIAFLVIDLFFHCKKQTNILVVKINHKNQHFVAKLANHETYCDTNETNGGN